MDQLESTAIVSDSMCSRSAAIFCIIFCLNIMFTNEIFLWLMGCLMYFLLMESWWWLPFLNYFGKYSRWLHPLKIWVSCAITFLPQCFTYAFSITFVHFLITPLVWIVLKKFYILRFLVHINSDFRYHMPTLPLLYLFLILSFLVTPYPP